MPTLGERLAQSLAERYSIERQVSEGGMATVFLARDLRHDRQVAIKMNDDSPRITPADMEPLHAAGWTDAQIWYAITVCALLNFYNRWIDATGVCALSDEAHREGGKRSAAGSYARKP